MDLPVDSLPPEVCDLYREYKRRQKILVAWLQQEGQVASQYDNQKYDRDGKLPIIYLEHLTASVVARKVAIPDDIIYSARTMLNMRKEVALHYRNADEGHSRCIIIFEQIVANLSQLPRIPASPPKQKTAVPMTQAGATARNAFAALPHIQMPGLGPGYVHPASSTSSLTRAARKAEVEANSRSRSKIEQSPFENSALTTYADFHALLQNIDSAHWLPRSINAKIDSGCLTD